MTARSLFINKDRMLNIRQELAMLVGLNEAIVLNQIEYWLEFNERSGKNFIDGRYWTFNTYEDWQRDNFPFWSIPTIKRIFAKLEKGGYVISANHNTYSFDKTKWYSIDYKKLEESMMNNRTYQNDTTDVSFCDIRANQDEPTNTREYYTENTSKSTLNSFSKEKGGANTPTDRIGAKDDVFHNDGKDVKGEVLTRTIRLCRDKLFYDDDSVVENIINTISYYFDKYHEHTGGFHPRMSDQTLIKVIEKLVEGSKDFEDLISFDNGYYSLIDKHFTVNYGKNIDWHLPHFATEGIIQRLAYKSDYY